MASKIYLLKEYTEYFSRDQLESVAIDEEAIRAQIEIFKEADAGAAYFDESISRKYSRSFRPESAEIFKNGKGSHLVENSINTGHKLIYDLVRSEKTKTPPPQYNIITGQLEAFSSAGHNNPPEKILQLTSLIEISNTFFEFLLFTHRKDFTDMQFLNFVEGFQMQKRDLLKIVTPLQKNDFQTISPEAESWNFYGELFRLSSIFNLTQFQKKLLWNYIDPEVRTMTRMSLRTDQIIWLEYSSKSEVVFGLGYDDEREKRRYEDLKNRILTYGVLNSSVPVSL